MPGHVYSISWALSSDGGYEVWVSSIKTNNSTERLCLESIGASKMNLLRCTLRFEDIPWRMKLTVRATGRKEYGLLIQHALTALHNPTLFLVLRGVSSVTSLSLGVLLSELPQCPGECPGVDLLREVEVLDHYPERRGFPRPSWLQTKWYPQAGRSRAAISRPDSACNRRCTPARGFRSMGFWDQYRFNSCLTMN